jgi:hypothetical protein
MSGNKSYGASETTQGSYSAGWASLLDTIMAWMRDRGDDDADVFATILGVLHTHDYLARLETV